MDFANRNAEDIPWMEELIGKPSTSLPELLKDESDEVGTVVIFVISAVLTITILFIMAIFIDCRQQRLIKAEDAHKKRVLSLRIPRMRRPLKEDRTNLTRAMEEPQPSTSNVIV